MAMKPLTPEELDEREYQAQQGQHIAPSTALRLVATIRQLQAQLAAEQLKNQKEAA